MRYDASSTAERSVPWNVLGDVASAAASLGAELVVVGACARDILLTSLADTSPQRATTDVDVALAVASARAASELAAVLKAEARDAHRLIHRGVNVDVIPFGPVGMAVKTVEFAPGVILDVTGLAEASRYSDEVTFSCLERPLRVASLPMQCVLKSLAWRDRHRFSSKDAQDLGLLLRASSEGEFAEQCWLDADALHSMDHDVQLVGAYRVGRDASRICSGDTLTAVKAVLESAGNVAVIAQQAGVREASDLIDAFRIGLASFDH